MSLKRKYCLLVGVLCWFSVSAVFAQRGQDNSVQAQSPFDAKRSARLHTELGSRYFLAGQNAYALEELSIALAADSNYFQAYSVRGLVFAVLKDFVKAEADFEHAIRLAPNDPEVNNNYGWYLCETGKERQSIAYYLNALKSPLYETPDRAYTNAGRCALKAGDFAGAEGYLQQAIRLAQDGAPEARLHMAAVYYKKGALEEARRFLNDALKQMEPPTASALWLGIRLERKLGNKVTEGGYAAQLRSRYPESPEYQEFLNGKFND
jgi:type IV pilus assembly protein PilF